MLKFFSPIVATSRIPQGIKIHQIAALHHEAQLFDQWQRTHRDVNNSAEVEQAFMDEHAFYTALRLVSILGISEANLRYEDFCYMAPWPTLIALISTSTPQGVDEILSVLADHFFLVPEIEWLVGCKMIDVVDVVTGVHVALELPFLVESFNQATANFPYD